MPLVRISFMRRKPGGFGKKIGEVIYRTMIDTIERRSTYFYSKDTKSVVKMTADTSSSRGEGHYELELTKYSVR